MKEITITIPDNYDLIKEGNTYVLKEKDTKPKSWKEFCENFPILEGNAFIDSVSTIHTYEKFDEYVFRDVVSDKNMCVSKEEAEAFLALMQLRQLRKAWVGDWEQSNSSGVIGVIFYDTVNDEVITESGNFWTGIPLSFPTIEMAREFLDCFKDLCETAKILL